MKRLGLRKQHNKQYRWAAWLLAGTMAWLAAGCANGVATPTLSVNLNPGSVQESQTKPVKVGKLTGVKTETVFVGWPDDRPRIKQGQSVSEAVLQELAALGNRPPEDLVRVQITLDLTASKVVKPYSDQAALLVSITNPEYNEMAIPVGAADSGAPLTVHQTWTFDRQSMLSSVPGDWQVQLQASELEGVEYRITVQAERGQPGAAASTPASGAATGTSGAAA